MLAVVTFPCMIRLRVVYGGWRVGQVLPPWQNRQISALDETADAPQSCLFSLLSSLQFYKQLSLFLRISSPASPSQSLAGGPPPFPWEIVHILQEFSLGKKGIRPEAQRAALQIPQGIITPRKATPKKTTHSRAAPQYPRGQSVHS